MSHERIAETFDQWAADGRDAKMEEGHGDAVRQVIARMGIKPGDQMLDLGCGNGWATRLLAKSSPGGGAVGIDVAPAMVAQAESLHSYTIRARYEVMPFERLDLKDGQFQRVFSMEALYYAVDLDATLAEIHRVLKPGGTVDVVIDFYKENAASEDWTERTGVPMHWLGEDEWKARFEAAGFTDVTTERVLDSRPVDEAAFEPDACVPDLESLHSHREAGSLWIHAVRP
jgi:ubiquinone/menaquinone biosynthesis C-methylase UbiE